MGLSPCLLSVLSRHPHTARISGVILSTQILAQGFCHTSPREHIRKSEQVNLAIPDTTGIRELFKHVTELCARDHPPSIYNVSAIVAVVVMTTEYDISSNIPGFAF
ncbi:uncharacterized protein TRAVEDRAFT_52003 [Trametes versicolor FP-101664 SS1]|uniref:uncharacterized protein n=1 Tax=Trametes versicolor (strain FP-101664) TaxID=717944 RepID=UPI0004621D3E|nr:uncharacterized protein TRAVEDRAFT_52003 [Trametes versicolor FP-101664 SS1]EIW54293.1 hypothetical protein TRAVEDRAFT_52003 [Trametes versicolor FP-101664 SS1]